MEPSSSREPNTFSSPTLSMNAKARRQPRAARSCELCRSKKTKCDEGSPCTYCRTRNKECVYRIADRQRRTVYSSDYVKQLERQVQALSAQHRLPNDAGFDSSSPSYGGLPPRFYSDYVVDSASNSLSAPTHREDNSSLDTLARAASSHSQDVSTAREVSAVNQHTKNLEFYGSSSSMSLLSRVQGDRPSTAQGHRSNEGESTLVSELHNPAFVASPPTVEGPEDISACHSQPHQHQYRVFLDGFFGSLHCIHPILDKSLFLHQCETLWVNGPSSQARSFMALYYSILSLGALVGSRDDDTSSDTSNMDWSQKLFNKARSLCSELSMTTDLEMCQCFFFMAKICQNELNPHLTYMYTGLAVRTALAMGINREPPPDSKKSPEVRRAESRTWWGLYSFETEMSFAMGRPDTLGLDIYHNRRYPQVPDKSGFSQVQNSDMVEHPQCAIIKSMVDFSRITRKVCLELYMSSLPPQLKLSLAEAIEKELDTWLDDLPDRIRPSKYCENEISLLKSIKEAHWMKRQRLVLSIRYHNVRMLLFASFLTTGLPVEQSSLHTAYVESISKCLLSAKQTIEIIHKTYRHNDFFRTWFYNTTYTLFAVSILLVYNIQEAAEPEKISLFDHVDMSIEILEAMDDCVVAKKAAKMISRALLRARHNAGGESANEEQQDTTMHDMTSTTFNHYWGPLNLIDGEIDVAFPFELSDLDDDRFYRTAAD